MQNQKFLINEYSKLPKEPGVYKFFNVQDEIIYVGKAKNLFKRVASYFSQIADASRKTQRLVKDIASIEFIIVDSEYDALLLENNLIKENQPKYNILLKDDKTFPSICITNDRFPLIYSTRTIDKSRGEYFGPYTNVKAMNSVLDLIRKIYTIRTCSLHLSKRNIENKKFKICLEYHIGNCQGPCEDLQDEDSYLQDIDSVRKIIQGKISIVKGELNQQMNEYSKALLFEKAHKFKQKIEFLDQFQSKSQIVNPKISDLEILGVISQDSHFFVNYMKIDKGSIIISETVDFKNTLDLPDKEILQNILFNFKKRYQSATQEIISNSEIEGWGDLNITLPQIGDKRKLLDLSLKNALFYKNEFLKTKDSYAAKTNVILSQLQKDLSLKELPEHIECFDNSNIQGTNPVAAMVCFKNAKPSKKDYRKYNIKTVIGPDDFSSMNEIVGRRYKHLIEEKLPLPQLIVIDGGKGQLHSACDALKSLNLYGQIPIIGIAKRLEEIYYPEDSYPLYISKKSTSLKLLQQLRDEAHRFAITFHRNKRSKEFTISELDKITGIGPNTRTELLNHFKSTKRIKKASLQELTEVIGESKAIKIYKTFNA
jgi:excinuclease ABC subunit C